MPDDEDIAELEEQAQVLMTQAAKRRAANERGRGFQKAESQEERERRVKDMKSRLCCSACKAHGFTRFGHWHNDRECPYYGQPKQKKKPTDGGETDKGVFAVTAEPLEDSDDDFLVHMASQVGVHEVMASGLHQRQAELDGLALSDTCCSRSVCGEEWMQKHLRQLWESDIEFYVLEDVQHFRFGAGPRVVAKQAAIIPLDVPGSRHQAYVKVSIVQQAVPLLLSKHALQALGAVLDLPRGEVEFRSLGCRTQLVTTSTGHVGFNIVAGQHHQAMPLDDLCAKLTTDVTAEVCVDDASRTRVGRKTRFGTPKSQEPPSSYEGVRVYAVAHHDRQCSSEISPTCQPSAIECAEAFSVEPQHGSVDESQDQSRVRDPDSFVDQSSRRGVGEARHEQVESHLEHSETCEANPSVSTRLEEVRSGDSTAHVCGALCARAEPPGRRTLAPLEASSIHHGVGVLHGTEDRGAGSRSEGELQSGVQGVLHSHVHQDEQADTRGVLGMHAISTVQADPTPRCSRGSHSHGPDRTREGKGSQGESSRPECHAPHPEGEASGTAPPKQFPWLPQLRRLMGASDGWSQGADRGGQRRRSEQEVQYQSDCGGVGCDHQEESRGREGLSANANGNHSDDHVSDNGRVSDAYEKRSPDEVRKLILKGNKRRRDLKKGAIRRFIGHARDVFACVCLATAAYAGATLAGAVSSGSPARPDCMEIFGGHAEVSYQFSRWGWASTEPIDKLYGSDLFCRDEREKVIQHIRKVRPSLVVISYPCRLWSPLNHLSATTPQAKRRLNQKRKEELPFLELCEDVFNVQLELGGDALGENPLPSESFKQPPIQRILSHPEVYSGVGHGCRFGIRHKKSQLLLKKPTLWFATAVELCDELALRCKNEQCPHHHIHDQCIGGREITEHAGRYTVEIAKAINRGFVKLLKRKEPSRIRLLLRNIAARIRRGDPDVKSLRWSEKSVNKALARWNAVFTTEVDDIVMTPEDQSRQQPASSGSRPPGADGVKSRAKQFSEEGITFNVPMGRSVSGPMKQQLRKIHCNLGHPSRDDLARFLKLGGANQEAIEALSWMHCPTCAHGQRPTTHRTTNIPPSQICFGDEACLDCIQVYDGEGKGHWFMSLVDRATSFHTVAYLDNRTPQHYFDAFCNNWVNWAGPPGRLTTDMEGGFCGREFWEEVGRMGTPMVTIAGCAHWQAGKVERHNGIIKDMFTKVVNHTNPVGKDAMIRVSREIMHAKNALVREHGWSPYALVFGREPRVFGELMANGNPVSYHMGPWA